MDPAVPIGARLCVMDRQWIIDEGGRYPMGSSHEPSGGSNDALRDQVDSLLEVFEQQRRELADVQGRLAGMTGQAWSSDNLARVTANVAGVPVEVYLAPEAFKRSTPQKLARSVTEAAQAAARAAGEQSQQAFASIIDAAGDLPDLPDLVPGAPSIKDLFTPPPLDPPPLDEPSAPPPTPSLPSPSFPPSPSFRSSPPPMLPDDDEDEDDDYYRNRRYLGGK